MSISVTAKKTLAALILAAPLTLAACGSGSEETAASDTSETTAAEETTTAAAEVTEDAEAAEGAQEQDEGDEGSGSDTADGNEAGETVSADTDPAAALESAFTDNEITYAQLAPVESGGPADEVDAAEIEGLVRGMYETNSLHSFLQYLPNNTCSAVLDEQGGAGAYNLDGVPDMPLNQIPTYVDAQPSIDSVTDIQVDGDVASATVTASTSGKEEVATQRFQREDGVWKFCN